MEWILILVFSMGNSGGYKALTSQQISGFTSEQSCKQEGAKTFSLAENTRYTCIQRPKGGK